MTMAISERKVKRKRAGRTVQVDRPAHKVTGRPFGLPHGRPLRLSCCGHKKTALAAAVRLVLIGLSNPAQEWLPRMKKIMAVF